MSILITLLHPHLIRNQHPTLPITPFFFLILTLLCTAAQIHILPTSAPTILQIPSQPILKLGFNQYNLLHSHSHNDLVISLENLPLLDNLSLTFDILGNELTLYDPTINPKHKICTTPNMIPIAFITPISNVEFDTRFSLTFRNNTQYLQKKVPEMIFPILCRNIGIYYTKYHDLANDRSTIVKFSTHLTSPDIPALALTTPHTTRVVAPQFDIKPIFAMRTVEAKMNMPTFLIKTNARSLFTLRFFYNTLDDANQTPVPEYLAVSTSDFKYNLVCSSDILNSRYTPPSSSDPPNSTLPVFMDDSFPSLEGWSRFRNRATPLAELFYLKHVDPITSPPTVGTTVWISTLFTNDTTTPFFSFLQDTTQHHHLFATYPDETPEQHAMINEAITTAYCTLGFQAALPPNFTACVGTSTKYCTKSTTQNLSSQLLSFLGDTPAAHFYSRTGDNALRWDRVNLRTYPSPSYLSPSLVSIPAHRGISTYVIPSLLTTESEIANLQQFSQDNLIDFLNYQPLPNFITQVDNAFYTAFSPRPRRFNAVPFLDPNATVDIRPSKWKFIEACGVLNNVQKNDDAANDPGLIQPDSTTIFLNNYLKRMNRYRMGCDNAPRSFTTLDEVEQWVWCLGYTRLGFSCPYDKSGKLVNEKALGVYLNTIPSPQQLQTLFSSLDNRHVDSHDMNTFNPVKFETFGVNSARNTIHEKILNQGDGVAEKMEEFENIHTYYPKSVRIDSKTGVAYAFPPKVGSKDPSDYILDLSSSANRSSDSQSKNYFSTQYVSTNIALTNPISELVMPETSTTDVLRMTMILPQPFQQLLSKKELRLVFEDTQRFGIFTKRDINTNEVLFNIVCPDPSWVLHVETNPTTLIPRASLLIGNRNSKQRNQVYTLTIIFPRVYDLSPFRMPLTIFFSLTEASTGAITLFKPVYYASAGLDTIGTKAGQDLLPALWPTQFFTLKKKYNVYYYRAYRGLAGLATGLYQIDPAIYPSLYFSITISAAAPLQGYIVLLTLRDSGLFYVPEYCTGTAQSIKFSTIPTPCKHLSHLPPESRTRCDLAIFLRDATSSILTENEIKLECFFGYPIRFFDIYHPPGSAQNFTAYLYNSYTSTVSFLFTAPSHGNTLNYERGIEAGISITSDEHYQIADDDSTSYDPRYDLDADGKDDGEYDETATSGQSKILPQQLHHNHDDNGISQQSRNWSDDSSFNDDITDNFVPRNETNVFELLLSRSRSSIALSDMVDLPQMENAVGVPYFPSWHSAWAMQTLAPTLGYSLHYSLELEFMIYRDSVENRWIFNNILGISSPLAMHSYKHIILDVFQSLNELRIEHNANKLNFRGNIIDDASHILLFSLNSTTDSGFIMSYFLTEYVNPYTENSQTFRQAGLFDKNSQLSRFSTAVLKVGFEMAQNPFEPWLGAGFSVFSTNDLVLKLMDRGYSLDLSQVKFRDMRLDPIQVTNTRFRTKTHSFTSDPHAIYLWRVCRNPPCDNRMTYATGTNWESEDEYLANPNKFFYRDDNVQFFFVEHPGFDEILCGPSSSNDCFEGIPCFSDINCAVGLYCDQKGTITSYFDPLRRGICTAITRDLEKTYYDPQEYFLLYSWMCLDAENIPYPCQNRCDPALCGSCKTNFENVSCYYDQSIIVEDSFCEYYPKPGLVYSQYINCCGGSIQWGSFCNTMPQVSQVNITKYVNGAVDVFIPASDVTYSKAILNANDTIHVSWSFIGHDDTQVAILLNLDSLYSITLSVVKASDYQAIIQLNQITGQVNSTQIFVQVLPTLPYELTNFVIFAASQTFTLLSSCSYSGVDLCAPYGVCDVKYAGRCVCMNGASGPFCKTTPCEQLGCYSYGTADCVTLNTGSFTTFSNPLSPILQSRLARFNDYSDVSVIPTPISQITTSPIQIQAKCNCKRDYFGSDCGSFRFCSDFSSSSSSTSLSSTCINGNIRMDPKTNRCTQKCECIGGWMGTNCDSCDLITECNNPTFIDPLTEANINNSHQHLRGVPDALCKSCKCATGYAGPRCECRVVYVPIITLIEPDFVEYVKRVQISPQFRHEDVARHVRMMNSFQSFKTDFLTAIAEAMHVDNRTLFIHEFSTFSQALGKYYSSTSSSGDTASNPSDNVNDFDENGVFIRVKDDTSKLTNYYTIINTNTVSDSTSTSRTNDLLHIPPSALVTVVGIYTNCHTNNNNNNNNNNPINIANTLELPHIYFRWRILATWMNERLLGNTHYTGYPSALSPSISLRMIHENLLSSENDNKMEILEIPNEIYTQYDLGKPISFDDLLTFGNSTAITHAGGIVYMLPLIDPNCIRTVGSSNDDDTSLFVAIPNSSDYALRCPIATWRKTGTLQASSTTTTFTNQVWYLTIVTMAFFLLTFIF